MCEVIRNTICNIELKWIFSDKKIAFYFRDVMNMPSSFYDMNNCPADYTIKVNTYNHDNSVFIKNTDATVRTKKSALFINKKTAECYLDIERIKEPESLYYFLINPLLIHVLALHDQLYIHGACIAIEDKGVCILGPRNSGKTTLSLLALLSGYSLLSDDCIFVNNRNIARSFYRPLHVHPDMGKKINLENRLLECEPYMKDEKELNYRIEKYHPMQVVNYQKIDMLIFSIVTDREETTIFEISNEKDKQTMIFDCIQYSTKEFLNERFKEIMDNLICLPAYQVFLGKDLFINPDIIFDKIRNELDCFDKTIDKFI